ncbi:MAG: hypothetical protein AB8B87_04785 [Granulosicoccus sp.]
MSTDANTDALRANSDTGIQLASLQYMDLENSILAATHGVGKRDYAVNLRADEYVEYGRFSLIKEDYQDQRSLLPDYKKLVRLPLFEAWPVFPDSLLSTEVAVSSPSGTMSSRNTLDNNISDVEVVDNQCASALYYNLHQPLPGYLGKQLYRAGTQVVALLSKDTKLKIPESSLTHQLLAVLKRKFANRQTSGDVLLSLFLENNGSKGVRLKNRLTANFQTECHRLAHVCHRLNVISKADIVLCDSSGVAVDAIRASVPAAFVSDVPRGFERLHQCIVDFIEHGNQQKLIGAQKKVLDNILVEQSRLCKVMSHRKSLHELIHRRIDEADRRHACFIGNPPSKQIFQGPDVRSDESGSMPEDLILHTQQTLCVEPDNVVKLKAGFESRRRKFQKFRESPVRFMEDSQSRLLRSLVTHKTQQ